MKTTGDSREIGPIMTRPGGSAAEASRPDQPLPEGYHIYESNPVPWWLTLIWITFLIGGASYLIINLMGLSGR